MTPLMARVKAHLVEIERRGGPAQSYREMGRALGIKSSSDLHRAAQMLIERGHVVRGGVGQSRSLRVVQHSCPHCGGDLSAVPRHLVAENGASA
jgi:SOS-response transcriptional repressor LexA